MKEAISWAFLILALAAFIFTSYNVYQAKKNNESFFLFGYRPVFVLTGSMEPYMMTNSLALTKEVTDIGQLEAGDVVTYHVNSDSGRTLRITHRITDIEDNLIYTKGDNNNVSDGYALTIDNIEAKVIGVCNATSDIAAIWNRSLAGKIFLVSITVAIICLYYAIKFFFAGKSEEKALAKAGPDLVVLEYAPEGKNDFEDKSDYVEISSDEDIGEQSADNEDIDFKTTATESNDEEKTMTDK